MPSITPMMSTILRAEASMPSMVCTTCCITAPPWPATREASLARLAAWLALSALCCTVEVISSMAAAVCSSELAC